MIEATQTIRIAREGARVYFAGNTFAAKDAIKAMGGHWDADRKQWWVGAKKLAEAEALASGVSSEPGDTKPGDDQRVYARVSYKGRSYYVIAEGSGRCRLTVLDGSVDFWADMADCDLSKAYSPREYRGRTEYTTLGSLRRFIASQKRGEAEGLPQCAACGKRGHLIEDMEDGMQKCRSCCDMPSD